MHSTEKRDQRRAAGGPDPYPASFQAPVCSAILFEVNPDRDYGDFEMATVAEPIEQVKQRVKLIPLADARREIDDGDGALIDVREPHEWDEAHLEGATHVPQGEL